MPLPAKQNQEIESFTKGTLSWWSKLLGEVGPQIITFVNGTLIPDENALLLQAFGTEYNYKKIGADMTPIFKDESRKTLLGFEVKCVFDVDIIKNFDGDPDAIDQDEQFFIEGLRRIAGIQVDDNSAKMDVENGRVILSVKILLGAV